MPDWKDGLNWEQIDEGMQRASVPGGWLIREYRFYMSSSPPQMDYEWLLVSAYYLPNYVTLLVDLLQVLRDAENN